jgi:hypothetical protein
VPKPNVFHTSRTLGKQLPLAIFSFVAWHGDHGTIVKNPLIVAAPWIKLYGSRPRWKQEMKITVGVWGNWWDYWRRSQ